jgi:nucleoside-diphosphate-sugar epimerase
LELLRLARESSTIAAFGYIPYTRSEAMNILVTGGTGDVGRATVARLVRKGHSVRVIGRRAYDEFDREQLGERFFEGVEYVQCDVTEYDALRDQVRGMEGIVHLAAIRQPMAAPSQEIFCVNCSGTYNVFQAAVKEGIRKISCASSINALGFNFGIVPFEIEYFPIDEEHPTYTTDAYSFSKQVIEDIADYFWRREGISSVSLRLPAVYEVDQQHLDIWRMFAGNFRETFRELEGLPPEEQRARVKQAIAKFDATRPDRAGYDPSYDMLARYRAMREDSDLRLLVDGFGYSNFWASLDARDSAQAFEKGLTADYQGSHPLFVNDSENAAGVDSERLIQLFFPKSAGHTHPLQGRETLVSFDRARALIGFEPEHHISDVMGF